MISYLQFIGRIFVVFGVMLYLPFNKNTYKDAFFIGSWPKYGNRPYLFIYILKFSEKLQGK